LKHVLEKNRRHKNRTLLTKKLAPFLLSTEKKVGVSERKTIWSRSHSDSPMGGNQESQNGVGV